VRKTKKCRTADFKAEKRRRDSFENPKEISKELRRGQGLTIPGNKGKMSFGDVFLGEGKLVFDGGGINACLVHPTYSD